MLTEWQLKTAQAAGRYDALVSIIEIKLKVLKRSLDDQEEEMKKMINYDSRQWVLDFHKSLIKDTKSKIEILEEITLK